ncbi:hypothetical protein BDD12DRAFT_802789 [Trichophaea hybrida]|nr:hypothetical protein BDD12DRAFT_802789 [Trichophaea hybrida]
MSLTMLEKISVCCTNLSCQKKLISDSWQLKHTKLLHAEHIQVAHQWNLTFQSLPQRGDTAQHREFNINNDSVEHLDPFPHLKHIEINTESESQQPWHLLLGTESCSGAGLLQSDNIDEPPDRDTQGFPKTNLQNHSYYPYGMAEEYKYTQCGIKKRGMKKYYNNILKEANNILDFPSFNLRDDVSKLAA